MCIKPYRLILYIPNSTSIPWRADSSEKQFSPRQPLRACTESILGLSKAQLYRRYKNQRTSAPFASPASINFYCFATLSAPWFGLGALEKARGDWSSWAPTPGAGLAIKGRWIPKIFMPYRRKKPWGPQASLFSAPGRAYKVHESHQAHCWGHSTSNIPSTRNYRKQNSGTAGKGVRG